MSGYRKAPPASWRRIPLPKDWSKIRGRILRRDDGRCQLRYPGCLGAATDVDHVHPDRPDDHTPENLQSACGKCHATKTGRELQARRPSRKRPPSPHPGLLP